MRVIFFYMSAVPTALTRRSGIDAGRSTGGRRRQWRTLVAFSIDGARCSDRDVCGSASGEPPTGTLTSCADTYVCGRLLPQDAGQHPCRGR